MQYFNPVKNLLLVAALVASYACARATVVNQSKRQAPSGASPGTNVEPSPATPSETATTLSTPAGPPEAAPAGPTQAVPVGPTEEAPAGPPEEAPAGPEVSEFAAGSGCSRVVYCRTPDRVGGALCQKLGCTQGQAENECKREVLRVCDPPITCPLRLRSGNVTKNLSCQPAICARNAIECGRRCCPANATFCGGLAGSVCCDGSPRPGCP